MKKQKVFFFFAAFWLLSCNPVSEKPAAEVFMHGENHLVLMHPSIQNLQTIEFLMENEIFPLADDYQIVGVAYRHAAYDYKMSERFIEESGLHHMNLYWVEDSLTPQDLFQENKLSRHYRHIFERSDGIVFFGGPDIPPLTYGQNTNLLTVVTDPHRHYFELSFLFHLLGGYQDPDFTALLEEKPGYCILGLCLGMQSMNVATGGSMIQDIPTQIYGFSTYEEIIAAEQNIRHRVYRTYYPTLTADSRAYHQIKLTEPGHMAIINGGISHTPMVYSAHHQATDKLGKGFKVTALSMDGKVTEAIEHYIFPNVIGVQFHPEARFLYESSDTTDSSFMNLFPDEKGASFHLNFWQHMAGLLP